jgi:hypothetical protein
MRSKKKMWGAQISNGYSRYGTKIRDRKFLSPMDFHNWVTACELEAEAFCRPLRTRRRGGRPSSTRVTPRWTACTLEEAERRASHGRPRCAPVSVAGQNLREQQWRAALRRRGGWSSSAHVTLRWRPAVELRVCFAFTGALDCRGFCKEFKSASSGDTFGGYRLGYKAFRECWAAASTNLRMGHRSFDVL